MGSRALVADSKETWVCSYLSLTCYSVVGAYAVVGVVRRSDGALAMRWSSPAGMGDASWSARASRPTKIDAQTSLGSQLPCHNPGAVRCCGQDQIGRSRLRLGRVGGP